MVQECQHEHLRRRRRWQIKSETLVAVYQTIRHHIQEDSNIYSGLMQQRGLQLHRLLCHLTVTHNYGTVNAELK